MTTPPDSTLKVLVFGASRRTDSLNMKLAALAARVAQRAGATVDQASMRDFDAPLYDGDEEKAVGAPKGAEELQRRLQECDAFIVSFSNAGHPPPLIVRRSGAIDRRTD